MNTPPPMEASNSLPPARGTSYLYMAAAFVVVVAGMRAAEAILNPLLLAIFLAVISAPGYFGLLRRGFSNWLALLIVIGTLSVIVIGIVLVVMESIAGCTSKQQHYQNRLAQQSDRLQTKADELWEQWGFRKDADEASDEQDENPDSESTAAPADDAGTPTKDAATQDASPQQNEPENSATEPADKEATADDALVTAATEPNRSDPPGDASTAEDSAESEPAETQALAAAAVPAEGNDAASEEGETSPTPTATQVALATPDTETTPEPETAGSHIGFREPAEPLPDSEQSWRDYMSDQFNPGTAISLAAGLVGSIGQLLSNAFLILLTVIFILLEAGTFGRKMTDAFAHTHEASDRAHAIISSIHRYIVIKTWVSLATGILIAVWLKLVGVPYANLWGLLAFFFNFIPNVGSFIAAVPAVLIAWLDLTLGYAVASALGFVLVNVVIGNFIEPRLMGRQLGLSPLVVFCSMIFWGWVLGPIGMLLSVPLTMTARIALEGFEDTRWIATLMGNAD